MARKWGSVWVAAMSIAALCTVSGCQRVDILPQGTVRTSVVYGSSEHAAFPGAVRLRSGEILVAFREGSSHAGPDGRILICRSSDGGKTWSKPDTVLDTPYDDRDPSLVETAGGAVLLNFFATPYDAEGNPLAEHAVYVARSIDGGQTWSEPLRVNAPGFRWLACSDNILLLPTGRLLLPAYGIMEGDTATTAVVLVSDNFGLSWDQARIVARDSTGRVSYNEPALVFLPDKRILCVLRTARADHWMAVSYSSDWGMNWTEPVFTDVQGEAADVLLTNRRLLVMGYRDFSPKGVSLRFSYDGGRTWEGELPLYAGWGDLAYASLVEKPQDELLVFYYADEAAWRFGVDDKRSVILLSKFKLPYPQKPDGLSCSFKDTGTISLRWNAVAGAHFYEIFKSYSPDSLGTLVANSVENQYALRATAADSAAYFRVVAVCGTNEGLEAYGKRSAPSEPVAPRRQ